MYVAYIEHGAEFKIIMNLMQFTNIVAKKQRFEKISCKWLIIFCVWHPYHNEIWAPHYAVTWVIYSSHNMQFYIVNHVTRFLNANSRTCMIDSDMDYPLVENNCSENKMANCIFINRFLNNTIKVDILWMWPPTSQLVI